MIPYRKTFHYDPEFPFAYGYRDAKSAQHELPEHVHDWYEFVYIHTGKGTFFIDHTFYDAEEGDIFLIPGNTIHRSFPLEENPKCSTVFYFSGSLVYATELGDTFSYLDPFLSVKQQQAFRVTVPEPIRRSIEAKIEYIHKEATIQQLGYRQAIRFSLQQMLLAVGRFLQSTDITERSRRHFSTLPPWLNELVTYIDQYPSEELTLSALAKKASITPAHLSRVFKRFTGINVTDYVNAKRIMKAKEMLLNSQLSIIEIGESCGFTSIPHFHRKFKEMTGMTPALYRRGMSTQ